MGKETKELKRQRRDFLLSYFDENSEYAIKEVNGFILEKRWNGNFNGWEVAMYSKESWEKRNKFQELHKQNEEIKSLWRT